MRARFRRARLIERGILSLLLLAGAAGDATAAPWDELHERSVSRSHQFIVYAGDPNARAAIAMDAEDAKDKFLALLDTSDEWKRPIVIQLTPFDAADPTEPASDVRLVNTEEGFKVEFNIVLGADPREARFPQQLVRALLLEYAFRNQGQLIQAGASYAEPPAWLVDGIASLAADPDTEAGAGLFRSLVESGRTPSLASFLAENPATLEDTPSRRLYSACSMSLVRLLVSLPEGHARLREFIRRWPGPNADPEAELLKAFPALNSGGQSLEKWWALGLASLSTADRYQGLSLEETSRELDEALTFDVAVDKAGGTKSFTLGQYAAFRKYPGAAAALNHLTVRLLGLEAQGNPLMREVIAAYQGLAARLLRHESSHLRERLAAIAEYRSRLATRMDRIADYLNWYEATQRTQASGSFDEYVRTADQGEPGQRRTDPITRYMDTVEQQLTQ